MGSTTQQRHHPLVTPQRQRDDGCKGGASTPARRHLDPGRGIVDNRNGQTMLFDLPHDEIIDIVGKGFTPDVEYGVDECKANSCDLAACDASFETAAADASGTVRIDYTALKGPFSSNQVVCTKDNLCDIDVASAVGNNDGLATI